jgi:LuxR family maltose regulon positive regulatory protein
VIFILDDFHAVGDSPPIRQALTFFMENLPPLVHLVIISRSEVPLPLSRLRAMREVRDVRTSDLLFSVDEVRHFAQQSFRVSLTEESTGILHEKAAGWVSALILFFHSLHRKTPNDIEQDIHAIKGSSRIISDYLDENVFSHLNREIRDFLIRTSILSRLNAPFCDRYLGISNSSGILMQLEKSHLFTFALDEDNQEYCYHQLFQEFLQNALQQELGIDGTRLLHEQAARILEQDGNDEEAVHHSLMAGSFDKACTILDRLCLRLIAENSLHSSRPVSKNCLDIVSMPTPGWNTSGAVSMPAWGDTRMPGKGSGGPWPCSGITAIRQASITVSRRSRSGTS